MTGADRYPERAIAWAAADAWRVIAGLETFGGGSSPWDAFATATRYLRIAQSAERIRMVDANECARALGTAIEIFDEWVADGYAREITVDAAAMSRERVAEWDAALASVGPVRA